MWLYDNENKIVMIISILDQAEKYYMPYFQYSIFIYKEYIRLKMPV